MTAATPRRIAALPADRHGYPVPWFVATIDGTPDFRVIKPGAIRDALRFRLCWICGQPAGANAAFVIGPMCAVNRVSAEPPSHRDCAIYAATHCPFLTRPGMRRRDTALPDGHVDPAGVMIARNPGVALVWVTRRWQPFNTDGGVLFDVGDPVETLWFAQGRPATRGEVEASIASGLPLLRAEAVQEGARAVVELDRQHRAALALVPA